MSETPKKGSKRPRSDTDSDTGSDSDNSSDQVITTPTKHGKGIWASQLTPASLQEIMQNATRAGFRKAVVGIDKVMFAKVTTMMKQEDDTEQPHSMAVCVNGPAARDIHRDRYHPIFWDATATMRFFDTKQLPQKPGHNGKSIP